METKQLSDLKMLCRRIEEMGARAVAIRARDVVVDERVSFKCFVPRCAFFGSNLMCPPNIMSTEQFEKVLRKYHITILIQINIDSADPFPKADVHLSRAWENMNHEQVKTGDDEIYFENLKQAQSKLYSVLEEMETLCVKQGYLFAAGLAAGGCALCDECVGVQSGHKCPYPFKARPSMEGLGIDVVSTAKKAGLKLDFSDGNRSRSWLGLLLVN
jgi:predicted metal-binding protein